MKKCNRFFAIAAAALLMCLVLTGCGGAQNTPAPTEPTDTTLPLEIIAENEQQLRELLAQEDTRVIHLAGEMRITEGFDVNGVKTLTGDGKVVMELGAELGQPMLAVSGGGVLVLDGPVLDCNYNADGIVVAEGARLECLSGTIQYAGAYGIQTYGDVTIEDISITDCEYISICAQTGSHVDMKGGTILRSSSNDIYVVPGASVRISGDTVMEGALEHGMINYGTLQIAGGKFGNVNNYLCDNYGELTVASEIENEKIEFYGCRNSVFIIRKGSTANISDAYIHDTQRQGISSLGGDTVIANCTFENTGVHSIDIQGGKATVSDVVITGSKGSGMEASNGSEVTVTNFTVNSCDKIGIASRGAKITATNITISNTGKYGLTCGTDTNGFMQVTDAVITNTGAHSIYIYDGARAEMENVTVSDGDARGIYVAAKASCVISGDSSFKRMAKGGVEVRGTLRLDDVVISDNHVQNSGAGIYVADGGKVTMNGGVVCYNSSAVRGGGVCVSDAVLDVYGTQIYGNYAVNHGGGLYAQKNAVVTLYNGSLYSNCSESNGDGVYILNKETKVTMSGYFYLGHNDVKVDNVENSLVITRDGLSCHSASDPLLLTPNYNAPEGTVVATCKSESAAKEILAACAPGDGSYELEQDGKNIVIRYASADMDMTGADTVEVSNFKELKQAIESADSKRNIILTSDIVFTERIRFPGGVTVNISDDGTKRTMSRAEGFTDSFFVTHYGTGLYLTGTAADMLVMDGSSNAEEGTKLQSLIRAAGSTEIRNVVLQNNGSGLKEHDVRGALVRLLYGDIKIYDSVLTGGTAYSGGALMLDKGVGYVENCTFTGNQSTIGGGAIRVSAGCEMEIVSSRIADNYAASTGGGIVALGAAKVTATNTTFENNTAKLYGGAVSAQDADTQIRLIGNGDSAVIRNNRSETAGAVYAVKGANVEIDGYTFDGNAATAGRAGAVSILDQSSATVTNTKFCNNTATASAGALSVDGSSVKMTGCEFTGNTAGDKGGAILVMQSGTVEMSGNGSIVGNTASGEYGGGAAYVDANSELKIADHTIEDNKAVSGGAIYIAENGSVTAENNQFIRNQTTSKNGGAVYCAGKFSDTGSSYTANSSARHGGAVIVMGTGEAVMVGNHAVMQGNTAPDGNGGAVFVNSKGKATVTGYALEGNESKTGSIQVQVNASAELNDMTFSGSGNGIYVNGDLVFANLTGASIYQTNADAVVTVNGFETGNVIEFTPKAYEIGKQVLVKGENLSDETFQTACENITVAEGWYIENGELKQVTAISAIVGQSTKYFAKLEDAVAFANAQDGAVEIRISSNISVNETIVVEGNVTVCNENGKTVTIFRGEEFTADLFAVNGTLTLGSNGDGALIVDGTYASTTAGRLVTVNSGAVFTLAKNAVLQNAKASVTGAAIQTASAETYLYGTIQNNISSKQGAALDVLSGAKVQIDGASFVGNRAAGVGGAIQIVSGAEVTCQNAIFENNKSLTGKTYSNGGAIYCAGIYTDTNSSYVGNQGKNGGAIIVMSGGEATLTGTDAAKAVMQNNTCSTGNGGAIFVNGGGKATVTGYKLENNAIQVQANAAAELNSLTFAGDANAVYVNGSLTFRDLTEVTLVQSNAGATFTVNGYETGNVIAFTPKEYKADAVALIQGAASDDAFRAACAGITVADGWYIDQTGHLKQTTSISAVVNGNTQYFDTLEEAVAFANAQDSAVEIQLSANTSVAATIEVNQNITIRSAEGKSVTVSRGAELTGDLFTVNGTLIIGGSLTVDGASTDAIAGRTVTVNSGAAFTLEKEATLQNANSTLAGAAIHTSSADTFIYGTVQNNATTVDCAGLYVNDGAGATVNGAVFSGNKSTKSGAGAALLVRPGATVTCENAIFEGNTVPASKNGGAIYVAGTFHDTNSTYTGNTAKNGGAIFLGAKTAVVNLIGTDAEKAVFKDNQATGASTSKGGALYNNGGTLTVNGYTFTNNTCQQNIASPTNIKNAQIWNASGTTTLTDITMN